MGIRRLINVGVETSPKFANLAAKVMPFVKVANGDFENTANFMRVSMAMGARHVRPKYIAIGFVAGAATATTIMVVRKVRRGKKCGL